jgi:hypothetical protein
VIRISIRDTEGQFNSILVTTFEWNLLSASAFYHRRPQDLFSRETTFQHIPNQYPYQLGLNLKDISNSLPMWANSNASSNKCVKIMALKSNQLQVTTYKQLQSLSDGTKLCYVNDMLRSFDLENNHENLETQGKEDNTFDFFLHSIAWLPSH